MYVSIPKTAQAGRAAAKTAPQRDPPWARRPAATRPHTYIYIYIYMI